MYAVNNLTLQLAQQLFLSLGRFRSGQTLVGVIDGINTSYTTPSLEKFIHNLPFTDISIFYNGGRLKILDDYTVIESGGIGTGYDTVVLAFAPLSGDHLIADYIV